MEEMECSPPSLLNLPTEIIEKIFVHSTLSDRKNLRLTCKWFYELCNSDRFCRDEKIIWSKDLIHLVNSESDLLRIGRSYYNLKITQHTIEKSSILPFFEKLGSKIRSLAFNECYFKPGSLESIIMVCEGLCSLCLDLWVTEFRPSNYYFMFESLSITRPHVTHLMITLPPRKPYVYFHRMLSIFPNVKRLQIRVHRQILEYKFRQKPLEKLTEEFSSIFDDIMKSSNDLECLELRYWHCAWIIRKAEFFEALPRLKDLTVEFSCYNEIPNESEQWYPSCSNLVSVKLSQLRFFRPPEMIRVLTNTRLKYLTVQAESLVFNEESFKRLVASQLDTISFDGQDPILGLPMTVLDSPLEDNISVKYLYLRFWKKCSQSTEILFPKYFSGLVHLTIDCVTDSILQGIFEYQTNLQSLELTRCQDCSMRGFWGSEDTFEYSINNLEKLEHLTISSIRPGVIYSDEFKRAFSFSRLKYLRIEVKCWGRSIGSELMNKLRYATIPIGLYENLTELEALRLKDFAMPSSESLPSLFTSLKHLHYLRCDMIHDENRETHSMTYINVNWRYFSITDEKFRYENSKGQAFRDEKLDRMIILNGCLEQKLLSPKIGAFEINWIEA